MSEGRIEHRDFWITTADGARLDARSYFPVDRTPSSAVVVLHGLGGSLNPDPWELRGTCQDNEALLARGLAARGFHVLAYSQRGHGGSDGVLSVARSLEDLRHVARTTLRPYRDALFATGMSFGGYVSLLVAGRSPGLFRAVAPVAAPHSLKGVLPKPVHSLIRGLLRLPLHDPLARVVVAGIKLFLLKKNSKGKYLRALWTDPVERAQLFTHLDECRLPARVASAYEDLQASPDLADLPEPIACPVLLLVGDRENLVHGSGSAARDRYLSAFRDRASQLEVRVLPGAGHEFSGPSGRSQLEHDHTLVEALTGFFRRHENPAGLARVTRRIGARP